MRLRQMRGYRVDKKTADLLMKKNRKQRAKEQYPEKADVIEGILDRLDKAEKLIGRTIKRQTGMETRINNLADRVVKAEFIATGRTMENESGQAEGS